MALNQEYVDYIMDQLSEFDGASPRKMFGGVGIFKDKIMFAMVTSENTFYFRINDQLIPKFEAEGMKAFDHAKKGKGMPYWSAPVHVIEDKKLMKEWAKESFEAALIAKKK